MQRIRLLTRSETKPNVNVGLPGFLPVTKCLEIPVGIDPSAFKIHHAGSTILRGQGVVARVFYPAISPGEDQLSAPGVGFAPLVLIAHGMSGVRNAYLGFEYFQRSLAEKGIVSAAADFWDENSDESKRDIDERELRILRTFELIDNQRSSGAAPYHQIDPDRLGLLGHSRGGEAVLWAGKALYERGLGVRGVLAVAPTDLLGTRATSSRTGERMAPHGYNLLVVLPAADGQVLLEDGMKFYDRATPDKLKVQLYAHYFNHNFFNELLSYNDGVAPVYPPSDHQRLLDVYGSAFFRNTLLGHATDRFLEWRERPGNFVSTDVHLSFKRAKAITVDDHERWHTHLFNSQGLLTSATGGLRVTEYPFSQHPNAYNGSFYGDTRGLILRPPFPWEWINLPDVGQSYCEYRSPTFAPVVRDAEVWLRVAEVLQPKGLRRATPMNFEVGVQGFSSGTAWVTSSAVGGVPRPFNRPDKSKTVLKTLRFPMKCFMSGLGNARYISAVLIRFEKRNGRAMALDDLQIVYP